jgi:hypothetical protein
MKENENEHTYQDELNFEEARKFVKELREMPYDDSKVGQAFVIVPFKCIIQNNKDSEEKKKSEEKKDI